MPYDFEERSDSLFCDNIMAIVKRDMKAMLDEAFPLKDYPDFVERTLGRFFKQSYPTFSIDPDRNAPQVSADGSYVEQTFRANLFMAVEDADPPTVTQKAMDYMVALKRTLRRASIKADYEAGFPAGSIAGLQVELSYEYGLIGKNATGYEKPVNIELTLTFLET